MAAAVKKANIESNVLLANESHKITLHVIETMATVQPRINTLRHMGLDCIRWFCIELAVIGGYRLGKLCSHLLHVKCGAFYEAAV